ncbi:MAG: Nitrogen assimilation transcription factor nit-4 [Pycnora praestabilis]|nr:MAG: Nitrogen assimilation transcription factor nit-4 [Pycnora praestabilis]
MASESDTKTEEGLPGGPEDATPHAGTGKPSAKSKSRNRDKDSAVPVKRRCAACSSVYGTECIYDPNSDHRRKGVYKKDIDNLKTRNSTLQTLVQAILNYPEEEVPHLVRQIRTCESLDEVAESILAKGYGLDEEEDDDEITSYNEGSLPEVPKFETELSGKMGQLRLDDGSVRFIGGTSNLIFLGSANDAEETPSMRALTDQYQQQDNPIISWTTVTSDPELIIHLVNMYFTWHYTYFTTLSKNLFYRDFLLGKPPQETRRKIEYCTPLLVNAILALGCHFTSVPAARSDVGDSATAGDHFFKEAKKLIMENDEHEKPKLTTVQALALMSVREAGCGREAKGWVYSGMSFRMAYDLGLNLDTGGMTASKDSKIDDEEIDARRITFWGCFLFDKCWSNYLGRQPQLPVDNITAPKFEVFPVEDADIWSPYTDMGMGQANSQPSRTRAVALQISNLCEISSDLLIYFYHPTHMEKPVGKQTELKKLGELHTRLEAWRKNLPKEMEPKEGQLSSILVMHMFFQLLFIHLFRPFLKYNQATSPLPAHVSPRKLCTQAASMISKLLRLYKRTYGLRQICNIAVYIAHSACTIHLLNLPDKNAKRDIVHGVKHLEEIAEGWLCARRTLGILSVLARNWTVELPEEAATVLARTDAKFGVFNYGNVQSPSKPMEPIEPLKRESNTSPPPLPLPPPAAPQNPAFNVSSNGYLNSSNIISPAATPEGQRSSSTMSLPPQSAAELQKHYARQQHHNLPQQSFPNQDHRTTRGTRKNDYTSPSALFGGVDQLIGESQDWWLKDQSALAIGFDNWNGMDAASDSSLIGSGMNGMDNINGMDGMNGVGNGGMEPDLTMLGNGINGYIGNGQGSMDEWYSG